MSLDSLYKIVQEKSQINDLNSYTSRIFKSGIQEMAKKFGEEGVEVVVAALSQDDQRLIEESVDALYHLMCILVKRDISLEQVNKEIESRMNSKKDEIKKPL